MANYNLQSSTSGVSAKPVFQMETDYGDFQQFENVLGFMISTIGKNPLKTLDNDNQLEYIAKNAVSMAQELLEESVYSNIMGDHTWDLYHSIKYRKDSNSQIILYSDARDRKTKYPYAGSIEYGFHPWGHNTYVPPRPFLRPALQFAATATRASLEAAIQQMFLNYRDNNFGLSHFGNSANIIGASRRYWGVNASGRFTNLKLEDRINFYRAQTSGRNSGKYSEWRNSMRYGTERRQYSNVWKIDKRD